MKDVSFFYVLDSNFQIYYVQVYQESDNDAQALWSFIEWTQEEYKP